MLAWMRANNLPVRHMHWGQPGLSARTIHWQADRCSPITAGSMPSAGASASRGVMAWLLASGGSPLQWPLRQHRAAGPGGASHA